jgi:hypothetical protein
VPTIRSRKSGGPLQPKAFTDLDAEEPCWFANGRSVSVNDHSWDKKKALFRQRWPEEGYLASCHPTRHEPGDLCANLTSVRFAVNGILKFRRSIFPDYSGFRLGLWKMPKTRAKSPQNVKFLHDILSSNGLFVPTFRAVNPGDNAFCRDFMAAKRLDGPPAGQSGPVQPAARKGALLL